MRATLLVLLALSSVPALGDDGAQTINDESQSAESRAAWNIAIMKALVGTPNASLDARQRRMIQKLKEQGRDIKPLPEGPDRQQLQARLSDDELRYNTILTMRDPYTGSYDTAAMRTLTQSQKGPIERYWKMANGPQTSPPPNESTPSEDNETEPNGSTEQAARLSSNSKPFPGSAPASGAVNSGDSSGNTSSGGASPNSAMGNPGNPELGKLRDNFSKALGTAKDGAASFKKKEDNLNSAPKPARPQTQPRPHGPPPSPNQAGPEFRAPAGPAERAAQGSSPARPSSASSGVSTPSDVQNGSTPSISRKDDRVSMPVNSQSISARTPGSSAVEGPSVARVVGRSSRSPLSNMVPDTIDHADRDSLSPEEMAAIKEIQEMLAEVSGEDPLDTNALMNAADKLEKTADNAVWKGVDINALREQIGKVIELAGIQGLSLSQRQIVYQAAANLGLSEQQAKRILKSLSISEPPSPKLVAMTWWQRLLAWLRYYKILIMRRLT